VRLFALGPRPSACRPKRPVNGRGQGREPPEAGARHAPALSPADHWSTSTQLLLGDRACLPPLSCEVLTHLEPVGRDASTKLDASVGASGPHDFTVRNNVVRLHAEFAHKSYADPPCDAICAPTLSRPPHLTQRP
jgi:hypothetical protein